MTRETPPAEHLSNPVSNNKLNSLSSPPTKKLLGLEIFTGDSEKEIISYKTNK